MERDKDSFFSSMTVAALIVVSVIAALGGCGALGAIVAIGGGQ